MLLPDNIHPELSIYYNGALVIKKLKEQNGQYILSLYENIKTTTDMSFPTFILCLDWLFLINVAEVNESGRVELCI
ncbi:conserved hypothetical protein [Desulfofarcimen acetoxidans DSM 771]|uniref:Uncharacterized protein n=1 Tax=Desulfofarcimen acetoxidans (strain ATCC 49208 / DSM 771 / KCTC 5769 / VKM B-1644 / 5575) TaxID=485916 RepID=C8W4L3_DESAS|nr:ABC-three component system middle component 6 [Desulfofarcimen acetoxidans]ACV63899.1 conserved hypothetical protein [Desulfofarcimen acetoxidans DSM 771]